MTKEERLQEIERLETALAKTQSPTLKRDYNKYLIRLKCPYQSKKGVKTWIKLK